MPRRSRLDLDAINAIASAQLGLVTARQLQEAGISRSTLQYRVRTGGPWSRLLPGIYLVTGGRPDRSQQLYATLLFAGPDAAATGLDALALHGVLPPPATAEQPVHVLVPHAANRTSRGFAMVERTRRPPAVLIVEGMPVATVARAAVDHARRLHRPSDVSALLARCVQRGFTTLGSLDEELDGAHRRSTALVRDSLVDLRAGTRSAPEGALRRLWVESGIDEPLWNPTLLLPNGEFLARPDAYVPRAGVVVEVDSVEFHFDAANWKRTMARQSRMTAQGLLVIAVPPSRVTGAGTSLMRDVAAAIRSQDGRPRPHVRVAQDRTGFE